MEQVQYNQDINGECFNLITLHESTHYTEVGHKENGITG